MNTLKLGIALNEGDDFSLVISINGDSGPIDITGYAFLGEMKVDTNPSSSVIAEFVFTVLNQVTNKGQVSWALPRSATAGIPVSVSDGEQKCRLTTPYVFDVKMKDTNQKVSRIIEGVVFFSPEVTAEVFP